MAMSSSPASAPSPSNPTEPFFEIDQALLGNRHLYFEHILKVREDGKEGGAPRFVPFRLNREQRHVDALLDKQLSETGRVRALVLKGRKQGVSTYVAGRYYEKLATQRNRRGFILAHEKPATKNLYDIYK